MFKKFNNCIFIQQSFHKTLTFTVKKIKINEQASKLLKNHIQYTQYYKIY